MSGLIQGANKIVTPLFNLPQSSWGRRGYAVRRMTGTIRRNEAKKFAPEYVQEIEKKENDLEYKDPIFYNFNRGNKYKQKFQELTSYTYEKHLGDLGVTTFESSYPVDGLSKAASILSLPTEGKMARNLYINSPQTLNALTHDMVKTLNQLLKKYAKNTLVSSVFIKGVGDSFSAGGNFKGMGENNESDREYFKDYIHLIYRIAMGRKPVISVADGITAGLGVGLFINSPIRVATNRSVLAITDAGMGYIPLGSLYHLSKLPHNLGMYYALTGKPVEGADLYHVGIANHYIPEGRVHSYQVRLGRFSSLTPKQALNLTVQYDESELPAFTLEGDLEAISKTFSKGSVEEIKAELASLRHPWAKDALRRMDKMSPLSLAAIHRLISDARNSNYYDFLPIEYRVAQNIRELTPEFKEGIAKRVLSGSKPNWTSQVQVDQLLTPIEEHRGGEIELLTPERKHIEENTPVTWGDLYSVELAIANLDFTDPEVVRTEALELVKSNLPLLLERQKVKYFINQANIEEQYGPKALIPPEIDDD